MPGLVVVASSGFFLADARAHDDENHVTPETVSAATPETDAVQEPASFPLDIGGPFELTDQHGVVRNHDDYDGRRPLVFFGYARCESICPVALKVMLEAVDLLEETGDKLQPILITIDPENETPAVLLQEMPRLHPRLIGLTGEVAAIADVQKLFRVDAQLTGTSRTGNPMFAHGSLIYLLGANGKVMTLLPPIFDSKTMAEKLRPYLVAETVN